MSGNGSKRFARRSIICLAVLLALTALASVVWPQPAGKPASPASVAADSPDKARPAPHEFRGFALQVNSGDPAVPFETFIDEIASTGANTVMLSLAGLQDNCAASCIYIDQRRAPSEERLAGLIKHAHDKGLKVVLMPIVLLKNPGSGEWRGKLAPKDTPNWWNDYQDFILTYAKLAQRAKVEVFFVGSELVTLEEQADRWRDLIKKVRQEYKGLLSYSANWDHYEKIEWWKDLDIVGMTSYYDLVGDKEPSLEVLVESWKKIKQDVLAWQANVGLPIMFTELGFPSQKNTAKVPWNYYGSIEPDPATQALGFESFFKVWQNEKNVAGVMIWEWRNFDDKEYDPKKDLNYRVDGKPAMGVIENYFRAGQPASAPAPAK